MTDEPVDNLIMISALQHYVFCPRQCALIHIEQTWAESGRTAEGRIMHECVHDKSRESRGKVRIEYGVALRSHVRTVSERRDNIYDEGELIREASTRKFLIFAVDGKNKGRED